jgi:starch synthase (maltosyl-transferring)
MQHTARARVVIEDVQPQVDCGRFPVKRVVGDQVRVTARVFADGHDAPSAALFFRASSSDAWSELRMASLGNDRWRGEFTVDVDDDYVFCVRGWVDRFITWQRDMQKRLAAQQNVAVDVAIGNALIKEAANAAGGADGNTLHEYRRRITSATDAELPALIDDPQLAELMFRCAPRRHLTRSADFHVSVDRELAAFSAWYEMFPRSAASEPRHGALKDVERRLSYVADMGFDVLYLPPIHPIGRAYRKGPNNSPVARPEDPGSPWAIGGEEGGHKSIHPELGSIDDFRDLVRAAKGQGIELAMDIAFQCAPDHPYVREHPEWFRARPDGTIQYAENPPKKYQDIYPFDFESDAWESLWHELRSIFLFWAAEGVRIFRVDNPHTKPFPFWEWVIREVRAKYRDAIFLAEAFTRPAVMHRLAKLGFTQSYTYFSWRDSKAELTQYLLELTQTNVREFFRPNFWPNTPDILPESLQVGTRGAYMARLVLAATLVGNYGIYGPPFEHQWSAPREPGSEEYLHSEKYQIHQHDVDRPDSLRQFIKQVNAIRRAEPAFREGALEFHPTDNDQIICYSRTRRDGQDAVLIVVNLDAHYPQSAWIDWAPPEPLASRPIQMHDLLTEARFLWHGNRNFVQLDPAVCPAHIFRVRRKVRSERDFDYYL